MNNSERIAFNTFVLYAKMLVAMVITLFSARLLLQAMGESDYGLYNLVAGVIAMLSFVNGAMSNAVQRFFSYSIGENIEGKLRQLFESSFNIHCHIALAIFLILELFGIVIIEFVLNITVEQRIPAHIAFQSMVFSYCAQIVSTPLDALIVANERFYIFAIIELFTTILKLFAAIILLFFDHDKVITYSIMILIINYLQIFLRWYYCHTKFNDIVVCGFSFGKDLDRNLLSFAGWNMIESLAWVGKNQGLAIILNIFMGTVINAAYSIANQVNSHINFFSATIQKTFRPQIIQSAGRNDIPRMLFLSFTATKLSFYLMFILSLPVILNIDYILSIWLDKVPEWTAMFCVLFLIATCISQLATGFNIMVQAVGKIKTYNIVTSLITLIVLPLSYFLLLTGYPPSLVIICMCLIEVFLLFTRLYLSSIIVRYNPFEYLYKVLSPICGIIICATIPSCIIFNRMTPKSMPLLLLNISITLFLSCLIILIFSSKQEKYYFKRILKKVKI